MRKFRVLVMMDESLVPPASVAGMSAAAIAPFKTEHDVLTAINALGHEVMPVGVKTDLAVLQRAVREFRPHICFNLVEDFDGIGCRDQHVVSYLELVNQPYTGANPRGLMLARDKALTKKVLSYHGIRVPRFEVFPVGRPIRPRPLMRFPVLVKALLEEGSLGISQASVVYDQQQLAERVSFLHETHFTDVIAEQYIDGRELYVAVLGNRKLQTLPIWELCMHSLPPDSARIATAKVKWDEEYRLRHGIESRAAADLSPAMQRHIAELGREVYRALELSGYARIDLRLTPEGEIYLLEANPNPQIARGEDFADSACAAGIEYEDLLQRILTLGLSYRPLGVAAEEQQSRYNALMITSAAAVCIAGICATLILAASHSAGGDSERKATTIAAPGEKLKKLADGFTFTEGPASDIGGNVFFTDQPNDRILKWSVDGTLSTWMQPCGRSNGLCFDAKGNLIACADEHNQLWSITPDRKVTVLSRDYQGKPLNGPNDVWIRPDGGIYITDPYYRRDYWKRDPAEQLSHDVYFLSQQTGRLVRVIDDMKQPNGIIGTPDGKTLYVSDIDGGKTFSYVIETDGTLSGKKLFCELGSDGMTIDNEGNVYLTGHGVTVFDPNGRKIDHIDIDEKWTGNVCFGGRDRQLLFITASKSIYGLRTRVKGVGSQ